MRLPTKRYGRLDSPLPDAGTELAAIEDNLTKGIINEAKAARMVKEIKRGQLMFIALSNSGYGMGRKISRRQRQAYANLKAAVAASASAFALSAFALSAIALVSM